MMHRVDSCSSASLKFGGIVDKLKSLDTARAPIKDIMDFFHKNSASACASKYIDDRRQIAEPLTKFFVEPEINFLPEYTASVKLKILLASR
jgi:hypothetical protein